MKNKKEKNEGKNEWKKKKHSFALTISFVCKNKHFEYDILYLV